MIGHEAVAGSPAGRWISAGRYTVWGAGVLASASTLYDLAVGYGGWNRWLGVLLPVSLDLYWMTALGVAVDPSRPRRNRMWAAAHAFTAITVSVTGNVLFHEMHAGNLALHGAAAAFLVAVIASVPVLAAGALTHLSFLARPVPEPAAAGGAVLRTAAAGNQGHDAPGSGTPAAEIREPVPAQPGSGEPDAGDRQNPEPAPEVRPALRAEGKAPAGNRDSRELAGRAGRTLEDLAEAARPGAVAYYAEHGKHEPVAEVRLRLAISKVTACDVMNVLRPQIEAAAAGDSSEETAA